MLFLFETPLAGRKLARNTNKNGFQIMDENPVRGRFVVMQRIAFYMQLLTLNDQPFFTFRMAFDSKSEASSFPMKPAAPSFMHFEE